MTRASAHPVPRHIAVVSIVVRLTRKIRAMEKIMAKIPTIGAGTSKGTSRRKGRWFTDIAYIYARISESAHLQAAQAMANASGVDMEHGAGWVVQSGR